MPKCPRCGKGIDSIINVQSGCMEYVLKVGRMETMIIQLQMILSRRTTR